MRIFISYPIETVFFEPEAKKRKDGIFGPDEKRKKERIN